MTVCSRRSVSILSLAILAVTFGSTTTFGQLVDQYPSETLLYAQWAGKSLEFDGSMFGSIIREMEKEGLIENLLGLIPRKDEKTSKIIQTLTKAGGIVWKHPAAIGVTALSRNDDNIVPTILFLVDTETDRDAADKIVTELVELLDIKPAPQVRTGRGTCQIIQDSPGDPEVGYGFCESVFFLTIGPKGNTESFLKNTPVKKLAENKKYMDSLKAVSDKQVQLSFYADVDTTLQRVYSLMEQRGEKFKQDTEKARKLFDALGIDNISSVAGAINIVDKAMHTKIRINSSIPPQGVLMPLCGKPLSPADIQSVPSDALFFTAFNMSLTKVWQELHRITSNISPESLQELNDTEKMLNDKMQLSLAKDILPAVGDTWVLSCAKSQGGLLTGTLLTVELMDEVLARQTMTAIENKYKDTTRVVVVKSGKTEIRGLSFAKSPVPLMPAWAIHGKRLYLALWPQVIASALENKTSSLAATKSFTELRAKVSPGATFLGYHNTPEIARELYPMRLMISAVLTNLLGLPAEGGNLILPGTICEATRYLRPGIWAISHDQAGITYEQIGTVPSLIPVLGLITIASVNNQSESGIPTDSTVSMGTVEMLNNAARCYALDNNSLHPEGDVNEAIRILLKGGYIKQTPETPRGSCYYYQSSTGKFSVIKANEKKNIKAD